MAPPSASPSTSAETRIVALGKPSDHDRKSWYFQRYVAHLPSSGETVIFNRSWYNRAGVKRVMGFCTNDEYEQFMQTAPMFEQLLVHCGVTIIKYYLDISREEQNYLDISREEQKRLERRRNDPLRQWKVSPVDQRALKHWRDYSEARNEMLLRTHSVFAPWIVVKADDKKAARLNIIRDILSRCEYQEKSGHGEFLDPNQVFLFDKLLLINDVLAT
jgi:polyphosphate kinase 2 (PPK2 family)